MEQRTGKPNLWIAVPAFFLAAGLCAFAVWLFFRAASLPVSAAEGPGSPGAVTEEFIACIRDRNWDGAAALTADGRFPVPTPRDHRSALLWEAQQNAWELVPAGEYESAGPFMGCRVTITAPDLSLVGAPVAARVQSKLEAILDAAELESDVYEQDGTYRKELVFSCLDEALEEISADLSPYVRKKELTINLAYTDGGWRVADDGELISALTGGAVCAADAVSDQLTEAYGQYVNNLIASALEGLAAVPKVYKLSENTVIAPEPDPLGYGSTKNAEETRPVLEEAAELIAGRELIWTPETATLPGRDIQWYYDETILAIAWRQNINGLGFSFCEVVLGHPSQMRRYLADNDFHSIKRYFPTQMSATVNAVAAVSGDFYKYRKFGIVVYQRELFRSDGELLDTCFVNSGGDLLFVRAGELTEEEQIRRYIQENDVVFSLAFGPIMIEDGQNVVPPGKYPIGQIQEAYSRCVLCQLGECHYLLATITRPPDSLAGLSNVADALCSLGVGRAYALDGGQTGSLILKNRLINPVDFGEERTMSDIIYFATALPRRE